MGYGFRQSNYFLDINMKSKTIVILGGGIGGIVTANKLRKLLPETHRIILFERSEIHSFAPSYLWVMNGDRNPEMIVREVKHFLSPGIDVFHSEVIEIIPAMRAVKLEGWTQGYDYLVIAMGMEVVFDSVPGLSKDSLNYYTYDGSIKVNEALKSFTGGKIAVVICSLPYKCPAAPYEGALLISEFFRKKGIRDKTEINLYTPEPYPMPVAGPQLGELVKKTLESKGIKYHPLNKLTSIDKQNKQIHFEAHDSYNYDMLIVIPPHKGSPVLSKSGIANETGYVPVDRLTMKTWHDNIYALGDAAAIAIPGKWKPDVNMMLPKAGVFAHAQAKIIANNIAVEITGNGNLQTFCGDGYCMLEAGEGVSGFAYGNFYGTPNPQVKLKKLGKIWHLGKVVFEKWWLASPGIKKNLLGWLLNIGGKISGVKTDL